MTRSVAMEVVLLLTDGNTKALSFRAAGAGSEVAGWHQSAV
jgi:hypothetical protein